MAFGVVAHDASVVGFGGGASIASPLSVWLMGSSH